MSRHECNGTPHQAVGAHYCFHIQEIKRKQNKKSCSPHILPKRNPVIVLAGATSLPPPTFSQIALHLPRGARLLITTASPGAARVCFSVAKPEGESRQLKPVPGTQPPCISSLHAACPFSQLSQGLRNNYPMPINQQVPCLSTGR